MPRKLTLFALVFFCLLNTGFVPQQAQDYDYDALAAKYQPEVATLVTNFLTFYHYQRYRPDDAISKKLFESYLKKLDYNRMYFLASDIESFRKFEDRLDDDLKSNPADLTAAFTIFDVFLKRVKERVTYVKSIMNTEYDFSKDEYTAYDRKDAAWAKGMAELDELWRLRHKEEVLRFELRKKPREEYLDILEKRYNRLLKNFTDFVEADTVEAFLASLAEVYDPHSTYMRPATKDNFDIAMGHSLEGIGATLNTPAEYTVVVEIVKGGPADLSGKLKSGDKIIAVAQGDDGKPHDVVDMRIDNVVKKIRGPKGTKVRLTIIPADETDHSKTEEIVIVRDRVVLTSNDAKYEIKEIKSEDGIAYRMGVINVPSFYLDSQAKFRGDPEYKSTTRDVKKLLGELEEKKVDGIVVDLRLNGGGSLDEAIRLTGLFIENGPVVQIKDYKEDVEVERDPDKNIVYEGPLVVLTSVFSASASEIFSSAIQDYGRGVVVGGKSTHGKGTVQNVISLQNPLERQLRTKQRFEDPVAGALKVTTHKFYRVSGGSTQFKGVEPDVVLPSPYDGMSVTEETLDYALPWDEIDPVKHDQFNMVSDSLPYLKSNSAKRIVKEPEFRYMKENLDYREKRKLENQVTLNMEKRNKEKEELEAIEDKRDEERKLRVSRIATLFPKPEPKAEKKDGEEADKEEEKVVAPDVVLEECLRIAVDYVNHRNQVVAVNSRKKDPSN